MSFLNIKDPKKRDAIVNEYLATIRRIKHHNLQERARDFANHKEIEESLEPVVRSNTESTEAITKELVPIKKGITALNAKLRLKSTAAKDEEEDDEDDEDEDDEEVDEDGEDEENKELTMYEEIMKKQPESNVDNYFGILVDEEGRYLMGNKVIKISGDDIVVDGVTYKGTPGLWSLILLKNTKKYTAKDMENYKKLAKQTNVMKHPQNQKRNSRPKSTYKWKHIFKKMEKRIEFLPSDIASLQKELAYLLGEYRAGNTSATRNQIVAIADNLLKRKHITKLEYKKINNYIASS